MIQRRFRRRRSSSHVVVRIVCMYQGRTILGLHKSLIHAKTKIAHKIPILYVARSLFVRPESPPARKMFTTIPWIFVARHYCRRRIQGRILLCAGAVRSPAIRLMVSGVGYEDDRREGGGQRATGQAAPPPPGHSPTVKHDQHHRRQTKME